MLPAEGIEFAGPEPASLLQSTDYTSKPHIPPKHFRGCNSHTASKLVATLVTGALVGVAAQALQACIETGVRARNHLLQQALDSSLLHGVGAGLFIATSLAALAAALVVLCAPLAAGGGVAAVMAALNGNDIPGLLGLDVFFTKMAGCVLSRVATLAVGVEGPMVHLGACLASTVCRAEQGCWEWVEDRRSLQGDVRIGSFSRATGSLLGYEALPAGDHPAGEMGGGRNGCTGSSSSIDSLLSSKCFGDDEEDAPVPGGGTALPLGTAATAAFSCGEPEQQAAGNSAAQLDHSLWHREMVSAGVAAGIAGAFGAPLGGVLYALEEACTHWSRRVAWRCFLCATLASFVHSQLSISNDMGILSIHGAAHLTPHQWLVHLPLVAAVSAGAGLLGAALNRLRGWVRRVRPTVRSPARALGEAVVVAALTVVCIMGLSAALGSCRPLPDNWRAEDTVRNQCAEGEYDDLATMFLGNTVFVIKSFIGLGSNSKATRVGCRAGPLSDCYFTPASLAALCASYLVLAALSSCLVVPGGLFMPSIMVGASFGTLCGVALVHAAPGLNLQPGVFAIVGAAAVLGSVFRSSISLVAILMEGTQGTSQALGILVAAVVSNYVAHLCGTRGAYHDDLAHNRNVYFLQEDPPHPLRHMTAVHVMSSPVVGLPALVSVASVKAVLRQTTHNGFPVHTTRDPVTGLSRLDGFILRSQLLLLLRHRAFCDAQGRYLHIPPAAAPLLEHRLSVLMQERTRRSTAGRLLLVYDGASTGDPSPSSASSPRLLEPESDAAFCEDSSSWLKRGGPAARSDDGPALAEEGAWRSFAQPPPLQQQAKAAAWLQPEDSGGEEEEGAYMNLLAFMNRAPLSVRRFTPGARVHQLFLALSLRQLCVIDRTNAVVGIITRRDLAVAATAGSDSYNSQGR